ncbi:hypothetical protein L1987_23169 [Smallanthus sonchifolius]|uniref:Uncharacterized protein n=1 Tax=Smallanthus sonchifolius TaxID=185202 RepID=A0ACB9IH18_9ASTR|nr:hypothetical protein L1987_23169 [Smallanthus sonchifolius]
MDFGFTSSPHGGCNYRSAPSSPSRVTEWYCGFDELLMAAGVDQSGSLATVPFAWEEKPGVPKTLMYEDDFSFDVSCDFGSGLVPAEDLFHSGVIKTADSSPCFQDWTVERERGRERGFSSSRLPSTRSRRTRSLSPLGDSDYRREQQPTTTTVNGDGTAAVIVVHVSLRWLCRNFPSGCGTKLMSS